MPRTLKTYLGGLGLIYKNCYYKRNRWALIGLMVVACYYSVSIYFDVLAIDDSAKMTAFFLSVVTASLWFLGLPSAFYIIDYKRNPKRIASLS